MQDSDGYISKHDLSCFFDRLDLRNGRRRGYGKPGPTLDRIFAAADRDGDVRAARPRSPLLFAPPSHPVRASRID